MTSRDPGWAGVTQAVAVDVLPRADAVGLLRRRASRLSAGEAERIAELLGDLPLALEQAGAWLSRTATAVDAYCGLVAERTREILAEGTPVGYPVPVAATWTVALDRLGDPAAVWLLRLWALFGPEPVPADLVGPHVAGLLPPPLDAAAADPVAFGRLTETVTALGLVRIVTDGVVMHRLVQAVLRDHTPAADRDTARRTVHRLLGAAHPGERTTPAGWRRYARLYPHVLATGLVDTADGDARNMVVWTARYLESVGDYASGRALAERAHQRWMEILGEDQLSYT